MSDLALARSNAEGRFNATCTIRRDPQGRQDDVLDLNTGLLVTPADDRATVYSGRCFARSEPALAGTEEGGTRAERPRLVVRVPATTEVRENDVVTLDDVPEDLSLVGKEWRVDVVGRSSMAVTRRLVCEATRGVPRP